MATIRHELPEDRAAIHLINERAFNAAEEAVLVDQLREHGKVTLSLVAVEAGRVVGHILFSPITIETADRSIAGVGLAPMAVLPEFQNQGIGSLLVATALDECRRLGHRIAVVLGHPEFYPRFGFVPASRYGLRSRYDVRDEVFMALELQPGALRGCAGVVKYQPEFDAF